MVSEAMFVVVKVKSEDQYILYMIMISQLTVKHTQNTLASHRDICPTGLKFRRSCDPRHKIFVCKTFLIVHFIMTGVAGRLGSRGVR